MKRTDPPFLVFSFGHIHVNKRHHSTSEYGIFIKFSKSKASSSSIRKTFYKIDRVEAELEAYDFTQNKDLDSQIRDLETDETIDQELADLKKQVVNG